LLDWLAAELIRGGWSLKHMHRLIATSATYRQSSHARPELLECDPRNLLLGRQERLRLDAEIVRDVALSASGLLDRTIGGPSVHPPQPEGVYAFTQVNKTWRTEAGPNRYRRGLYIFFYRSAPYPLLTTFDSPDFQTVCTRRPRSNTPLQALNMANDAAFIEMARAFAARVTREAPGAAREQLTARIDRAFLLALCRQPSDRERSLLSEHFARQQAAFAQQPDLAAKLAAAAPSESTADAAALISVVRVILNTDNFITRE
jgi:hypothetical protein